MIKPDDLSPKESPHSRNALPATFREVIRLVEEGKVDTRLCITHRFKLADTPTIFPKGIAGNPSVLKAMIEVTG